MSVLLLLGAAAAVLVYHLYSQYRSLLRNLSLARTSGLPYVIHPWNIYAVLWLATYQIWLPLLRKLPYFEGVWVDLLDPEWAYRFGYRPFEQVGGDVFLAVSPGKIHCFVADAEAITQITTRRNDFPKPLDMYKGLDIYGKSLVSTEGQDWRKHRKLTAPSFGEKNNELVFDESVYHTQSLLRLWAGFDGRGNKTIQDPATDTMRFALYIISRAGFDVRVVWPHEEENQPEEQQSDEVNSLFVGSKVPEGHEMDYRQALSELLHNFMWSQLMPVNILLKSPFRIHRTVGTAIKEWGKYMNELFDIKKAEVATGQSTGGMDLFATLIKKSNIFDEKQKDVLKSDLLGNAFVIMLAGHETTANAIHFALLFLAMNWQSQKRLQEDIDKTLQGKPFAEWKYEEEFPKLFNGMAAAVMNETLRLLQPIINIPKSTAPGRPQQLSMGGQQYTIPGDCNVSLSAAIHRNPKYWPAPPGEEVVNGVRDTDRFRPERWLTDAKLSDSFVDINYDDEDLRGPSGEDTSSQLFKPVKGAYIPFSDGYRSCIGRRFAQVEILAFLAVLFSQYSVELAVDEYASDEEIERMPKGGKERKEVWQKAASRAQKLLGSDLGSIITLQLRGATIPIRLARRGEERFVFE